jgi:hypothetical protein
MLSEHLQENQELLASVQLSSFLDNIIHVLQVHRPLIVDRALQIYRVIG